MPPARILPWTCLLLIVGLIFASGADAARPNIVLIMADDLGYGDLGCYNPDSKIPTPAIDSLATHGMRLTDAHAPASVCVPSRYALLTGRYPFRMTRRRGGPLIDAQRETLASFLAAQGYQTHCVGKWHLGIGTPDPDYTQPLGGGPVDRGFHRYFGIPASLDIPPYYYVEGDRAVAAPTETIAANYSPDVTRIQGAFWREGKIAPGFRHDEVLEKLGERALATLDEALAGDKQPLFLYLALTAPHTPWLPIESVRGASRAGDYGDFVVQVDRIVGRILASIDHHQAASDTLVLFTSDNGPVWYEADEKRYGHRSAGPLRGMKGDAWEAGHRMPMLARWPGHVPAGSASDQLICHIDFFASLAAVLDVPLPTGAAPDSIDMSSVLLGEESDPPPRQVLITQSSRRVLAIRQGSWKLIPALGSGGFSKPTSREPAPGEPPGQLYHLDRDLGETENLWAQHAERAEQMSRLLEEITATSAE